MVDCVHVTIYSDPLCSWCWGSEPYVTAMEVLGRGKIQIHFRMGSLIPSFHHPEVFGQEISAEDANKSLANYWSEVELASHMPFEPEKFQLFTEEFDSGDPINIAVKTMQSLGDEARANRFLRKLREGIFTDGLLVNRPEQLEETALQCGVTEEVWRQSTASGIGAKNFADDLAAAENDRVMVYPTYLFEASGHVERLKGYVTYKQILQTIEQVSNYGLDLAPLERTDRALVQITEERGRITIAELQLLFGFSDYAKADEWIRSQCGHLGLKYEADTISGWVGR